MFLFCLICRVCSELPAFTMNRKRTMSNDDRPGQFICPDFSWFTWADAGQLPFPLQVQDIEEAAAKIAFKDRIAKLVWRGQHFHTRGTMKQIGLANPDITDIKLLDWKNTVELQKLGPQHNRSMQRPPEFLSYADQCKYRYLWYSKGISVCC